MYKAIFIDIDGTLRNDQKDITERTISSIKNICSLGIYAILCTGRPRFYTEPISKMCGASQYMITFGGAEVYDYQKEKVIYSNPMNMESCLKLYELVQQNNVRIVMYLDKVRMVSSLEHFDGSEILLPPNINEFLLSNNVLQCIILGDSINKMKSIRSLINNIENIKINNQSNCLNDGSIKTNGVIYYDVANHNTSKGNGIIELCKYLKIELDDTIGIGDDDNDLSMFEVVGHSVAMGNATNEIKKMVKEVISSNNEDGLAKYLEHLYNKYSNKEDL